MGLEFLVGDNFFGHRGDYGGGGGGIRWRGSDEMRVGWWVPDVWEQKDATNHMKRYSFNVRLSVSRTILFVCGKNIGDKNREVM